MLIPGLPSQAEDTGGPRRVALQDRCLEMKFAVLCVRRAYVHVFYFSPPTWRQFLGIPGVEEAGMGAEIAGAF